jgi:hypothetical protein
MKIVRDKATTPIRFKDLNTGDVFYDMETELIAIKIGWDEALCLEEDYSPYRCGEDDKVMYLEAELVIK